MSDRDTLGREAWVTLATNDSYAEGALVLANSLKLVKTSRCKVILITNSISSLVRKCLEKCFDLVVIVDPISCPSESNLKLLNRPELKCAITKIHAWNLIQFDKCVFLDADTLVIQNCDELFERDELSAVPDCGWPDCFNSGLFVYKPSNETYKKLVQFAETHGSFDGADQGLLNSFFSDWSVKDIVKHVPFVYNMSISAQYTYLPAFIKYKEDVRIVHFLGPNKPWLTKPPPPHPTEEGSISSRLSVHEDYLQQWHKVYNQHVKPTLCSSGAILKEGGGEDDCCSSGNVSRSTSSAEDRKRWEEGEPDYLHSDSFENILKKIDKSMNLNE